jgi:thiol:disulfide interchange protein DsbA
MLNLVRSLFAAALMLPLIAFAAEPVSYQEGVHYTRLTKSVRTADPSRVEVVELFGYWCPHCNNFEEHLAPWKMKAPEYVDFKHLPVVFRANQKEFAKGYYVAKALGLEEKAHPAFFDLIHRQRRWIETEKQLADFFAGFGISEQEFSKYYNSFVVSGQVNTAANKARSYRVSGVPSLVVNGKYLITADKAGGQKEMLDVVDFLVAREKAAQ